MRVKVEKETTLEDMMAVPMMGGTPGDEVLKGTPEDDNIWGGAGDDTIYGLGGDDYLYGNGGHDEIRGGAGDDRLDGGGGNDTLLGQRGDDTLVGSWGNDRLIGNAGNDVFVLSSANQMDTIIDFQDGKDLIGGLRYQDVKVTGNSDTTFIKYNGRKVAKLSNVSPDSITADDFQLIEPNDTIPDAVDTHLTEGEIFNLSSQIGDSPAYTPHKDRDLFKVEVAAGATITAKIKADQKGSTLDSVLTVFDSAGTKVAQDDDSGFGLDSYLEFTATTSDTYYVGVSSFANFNYDPIMGSGGPGYSYGEYDLTIKSLAPPAP